MSDNDTSKPFKREDSSFKSNISSVDSDLSTDKMNKGNVEYRNAREYARALQPWLYQYYIWSSINSFPAMMSSQMRGCFTPGFQPLTSASSINNISQNTQPPPQARPDPTATRPEATPQTGARTRAANGTEFIIPPLWKRVAAELVDFVVLFYMKIIVTVVVMRHMGYLRDDNILDVQLDLMPMLDLTEVDIDKAFAMTSEIIALEVVNRVFITIFEALCIRRGYGTQGGSTPGKRILGLKVVSCQQVVDLNNGRVLVVPAEDIGFMSALVRSVIKNFTVAFMFPACLTVFFFQNNRTAYDVLAKTIVVQLPHNHRR